MTASFGLFGLVVAISCVVLLAAVAITIYVFMQHRAD